MQFKELGNLFDNWGEFSHGNFKGLSSFDDLDGISKNLFKNEFKLNASGVSEFTMEQIRAKASVMGMTDSLTAQAIAMAKDADFTAKASTGKLRWKDALKDSNIDLNELGETLVGSSKLGEAVRESLEGTMKAGNLSRQSLMDALDSVDGLADSFIEVDTAVATATTSIGTYFKGIFAFIKPLLPVIAAVGAAFAAFKIYDALTLSYDEARENMDTAAANYEKTASEIESLNSELETTKSRIAELQALKDAGTITFAQEVELDKLERQNASLEKQLELKQKLFDIEAKEKADTARTSLGYKSEEIIKTDKNGIALTDNDGNLKTKQVNRFDYLDDQMRQYEQARQNVEKAQNAFSKAEDDYTNHKISKKQLKQFETNLENNEKAVAEYESSISSTIQELSGDIALLYDSSGSLINKDDQQLVDRFNAISDSFNGFNLSKTEKGLNKLNTFFSSAGGSSMKEYLEDIVKNGGSAQDALDAFRDSGMRLKDIDVSEASFLQYFEDIKKAAQEAGESVDSVDGSFSGLQKASESANQGADYDQTMSFYAKSKELYKKGLWGTDDFQSMAQFGVNYDIAERLKNNADSYTYASDAYIEAYEKAKPLLDRWYGNEDELVNMRNVLNDFSAKGLARNLGNGEFSFTDENGNPLFKTTAEAANAFETSVDNVELALSKLEEHGFEFDGIEKSGKLLNDYKSSLDGIKELKDSMEEGSEKERLSNLIDGWDAEYEKYQGDLSQLSHDQVVKIKFEYDLASIQREIQELREMAEATGDNEYWASLTVKQKQERNLLEKRTGYTKDSDEGYGSSYTKVDNLRASMKGQGEEARAEINKQISAIQDMQNAFQQFRLDGGELNWQDYLKSDQATSVLDEIMSSTQLTKQQLADLFGIDEKDLNFKVDADTSDAESKLDGIKSNDGKVIVMNIDATTEQIQSQIDGLSEGQTILFTAEIDGEPKGVEAVKNQDGTITYTTTVDDKNVEVELHKDGTVTYKKDGQEEPDDKNADLYYTKSGQEAPSSEEASNYYTYGGQDAPENKTATVYYSAAPVSGGGSSAAAAARKAASLMDSFGFNGTAHALGTAHASGDWSAKKSENSLVGELGRETIVRNGKFFTVGDNGAEFANIRAGDIVFNHKQTEELFKNGHVTSGGGRAKVVMGGAFVEGTAYASGGRLPSGGSSSSKPKKNNNNNNAQPQKTNGNVDKAAKATEEVIDWIEKLLKRTARFTEIAVDAIDSATGLLNKQIATSNAINKVKNEINKNQQAKDNYYAKADSLGLDSGYVSKIKDGSLNIETITDENLKKKISDYTEWYEKALDCEDKIRDLQKQEQELAQQRLSNISDYYDKVIEVNEKLQDTIDSQLEFNDAIGLAIDNSKNISALKDSIKSQEDTYNQLVQKLSEYQNEFNSLIANGYIKEGSDAWLEEKATINEFTSELHTAAKDLIELQKQLEQIKLDRLQMIIDSFERAVSKLDKFVALAESRNQKVPEPLYQAQIDTNNARIDEIKKKRDSLLAKQAFEDVGSKNYEDYAKQISALDEETLGLLADNEKLKDSIFELRFSSLDEGIEKLNSLKQELDDFYNLFNEDAFFDKNGIITEDGLAGLALLQQGMATSKQTIANLREGLNKLQESFDNNVISEKEYIEKSDEYRKGIRDSIADVKDYEKSLTDLYMTQMKTEIDALNEVIEKRKKALSEKAAYYDYDKKLKSQTKDVDLLKSQIAALEGVNNATSQAELKRLKEQLKQSEEELSETKRDHALDMQEKGYEGLTSDMEKLLEDTEYEIIHNSQKQQSVISNMLKNVFNMYESTYGKINSIISNTGWAGSNGFNQNQAELGSQEGASSQTGNATQNQANIKPSDSATGTVTDKIDDNSDFNSNFEHEIAQKPNIDNRPVAELKVSPTFVTLEEGKSTGVTTSIRPTDAKNKTLSWTSSNDSIATVSNGTIKAIKPGSCQITVSTTDGSGISIPIGITVTKKPDPPKPKPQPSNPGTADGIPRVGDPVTFTYGRYYYDSQGVRPSGNKKLGQTVYITKINTRSWATKPYHLSTSGSLGNGDLGWVSLDQLRGYKTGSKSINGNQLAWTQENGMDEMIVRKSDGAILTGLKDGDTVIPHNLTENLWSWGAINPHNVLGQNDILSHMDIKTDRGTNAIYNIHYDSFLRVDGNVDKDALPELEKILEKSYHYTTSRLYSDARKRGLRPKR